MLDLEPPNRMEIHSGERLANTEISEEATVFKTVLTEWSKLRFYWQQCNQLLLSAPSQERITTHLSKQPNLAVFDSLLVKLDQSHYNELQSLQFSLHQKDASHREKLESLMKELNASKHENIDLRRYCESQMQAFEKESNNMMQAFEEEKNNMRRSYDEQERRINAITAENALIKGRCEELSVKASGVENHCKELQEQLRDCTEQKDALSQALTALQSKIEQQPNSLATTLPASANYSLLRYAFVHVKFNISSC